MRVFMTPSCSSLAIRLSRCEARIRSVSVDRATFWTIWLRVSTSSPTSSMSSSSRSTSTRMVLSATPRRPAPSPVAAVSAGLLSDAAFSSLGASCAGSSTVAWGRTGGAPSSSSEPRGPCGASATGTPAPAGAAGAGFGAAALRVRVAAVPFTGTFAAGDFAGDAFFAAALFAGALPAGAAAAGAGSASIAELMAATTPDTSTEPSPPVASMDMSSARTVSTICSRTLVRPGVSSSSPSRSRESMFSPTCVTSSSRLKARKPLVPLMVWIVRKMLDSRSREFGSCSSATRSVSSWSRFSWLSTRNSSTMSSRPSTAVLFLLCDRVLLGDRCARAPVSLSAGSPRNGGECRRWSVGEAAHRGAQVGGHPGQLVDGGAGLAQRLGGGVRGGGDAGDVVGDLPGTLRRLDHRAAHLVGGRRLLLHCGRDGGLPVGDLRDDVRDLPDRIDRGARVALDGLHPPGDVLGRLGRLLGQLLDLVGHHREALARLTRPGRLDRRVQRQQVGLLGDRGDHLHHVADLRRGLPQLGYRRRGGLRRGHRPGGDLAGLRRVAGDLPDRGAHLLGARGHGLHAARHLLRRRGDDTGPSRRLLL